MESKVLRLFENNVPYDQAFKDMDQSCDVSMKVAAHFATSFDDFILDQIKQVAHREGIHLCAAINVTELANMIKIYDNSEYVIVTRCEKCQHWMESGVTCKQNKDKAWRTVKVGYCRLSGATRTADYFCADGEEGIRWMEESSRVQ